LVINIIILKITGDFGFCLNLSSFADSSYGGTIEYMSPEQHLFPQEPGNCSIDIWSFACTILEILTKKKKDFKYLIAEDPDYINKYWSEQRLIEYPTKFKELLFNSLSYNPNLRPDSRTLLLNCKEIQLEESAILLQSLIRTKILLGNIKNKNKKL
jgi:serine/threonine protein kinase